MYLDPSSRTTTPARQNRPPAFWSHLAAVGLVGLVCAASPAFAQEEPPAPPPADDKPKPPVSIRPGSVQSIPAFNWFNTELSVLTKWIMEIRGENYLIADDKSLTEKITLVSQKPVSPEAAWQAYLSAMERHGYSIIRTGSLVKIVKANEAIQNPVLVNSGTDVPATDLVITQLLPLENISAGDIQSVVNALKSRSGNIIAYQPTNTLIVTDHAYNIRKIWQIINELDVAAPRSSLHVVPLRFAEAAEVQSIIEQIYGVASSGSSTAGTEPSTAAARRRRREAADAAAAAPTPNESVTAGKESKYIDKIMADDRTNSLIILANEEGMAAVRSLIEKLDVDATDNSRSQIHVVRLEQAKAQDVVDVLSRLSQGQGASGGTSTTRNRSATTPASSRNPTPAPGGAAGGATPEGAGGAIAAFDSGMRIAHDEPTNSLVIIASPEDFRVVKQVIDELDRVRKQVFVDAVILEISSSDSSEFGLGIHAPNRLAGADDTENVGFWSSQLGANSTGFSPDLLSGVAMGVFGPTVEVPVSGSTPISIPAFGVVLQAIKTFSGAEVVSNPNILTLDNAEAKIVVGRKVPFPSNTSFNGLNNQPIVTFTREDVAVTMELTPRINSANYVTLEIRVEVSEVEPSESDDLLTTGGPTTSKREVETIALVKDNQTVVLGGLVGTTSTKVETKVPILGDIPVIGALFRGTSSQARKSNLLIFLTPHIVEDEEDMVEIMRVKEAQAAEFRRRFYGKSREEAYREIQDMLQYSMNVVDRESLYRGSTTTNNTTVLGPVSPAAVRAIETELDRNGDPVRPLAVPADDAAPAPPGGN
jgi:general secretion pathway protein D